MTDAAARWLAENDPDHGKTSREELEEADEADMYDIAPDAGEAFMAEALLFERDGDQSYVIRKRARPKGRQRVTRPAVLRRGGDHDGHYMQIHNDEGAIAGYLERFRSLEKWRRALEPHLHGVRRLERRGTAPPSNVLTLGAHFRVRPSRLTQTSCRRPARG
jgi:hypothetical protein